MISGGGVSIGSGGGESIGFTGPWKSGIGGCSIMSDAGATTVPIAYGRAGIGARVGDALIPIPTLHRIKTALAVCAAETDGTDVDRGRSCTPGPFGPGCCGGSKGPALRDTIIGLT